MEKSYYCKNCNSDPFTLSQKCSNFDKTLEKFHLDQGHEVVSYSEKEPSIEEAFTQKFNELMPKTIDELKKRLVKSDTRHIEKPKIVDSQPKESSRLYSIWKGIYDSQSERESASYYDFDVDKSTTTDSDKTEFKQNSSSILLLVGIALVGLMVLK